ncbi:MAG TPA: membrane dipeptidase [Polyangiales bacterium]|nr:membrane dipeptidase [Polyangiales bacterium]
MSAWPLLPHNAPSGMQIAFEEPRLDPARWAKRLGISREAAELYLASDVIDLHLDSFIWTRLLGYDLTEAHRLGPLGGRYYRQVDLPRILAAAISGGMWSITTNPLRSATGRAHALSENVRRIRQLFEGVSEQFSVVTTSAEYQAARAGGRHGAFLAVQGGHALEADLGALREGGIVRVTLVHLTDSAFGSTSSPLRAGRDRGIGDRGRAFIEALNAQRVFVDLAHIGRKGFFEAAAIHDRSQPLIVTHTGVSGVHACWRNIDDEQLALVADTGGVIGVMFHGGFLSGHYWSGGPLEAVVDHLAHIVAVAGEDAAAIGSDWDGAIIPPRPLRSCEGLPLLVQAMLDRGLSHRVIQKILGANFLRALGQLRP